MAGWATYADLKSEVIDKGKYYEVTFNKVGSAPELSSFPFVTHSLWKVGAIPAAGADPATTPGTAYDDTAGSMFFPDQSSDRKFLLSFGASSQPPASSLVLYDRLVGVSGISVASTGNKTINSAALPRYSGADSEGVECWLEVTTATTATAPVVSLNSYTNQAGTTGRAGGTVTFPAAATNVDTIIGPMPLQAGDTGIRSIEVGLNVATAASAGVINVLLLRRIAAIALPTANEYYETQYVGEMLALPRIFDGACLCLMQYAVSNTATTFNGKIMVGYG